MKSRADAVLIVGDVKDLMEGYPIDFCFVLTMKDIKGGMCAADNMWDESIAEKL